MYVRFQVAEKENLRCILGFFLHIPFPTWEILGIFPWDDEILKGILGKVVNLSVLCLYSASLAFSCTYLPQPGTSCVSILGTTRY